MITVHKASAGKLQQMVSSGRNFIISDTSLANGGDDAGLDPHDLLDAALGACTAITVTMVANRKQWPLTDVRVSVRREETDTECRMHRTVEFVGELTDEQRTYLLGIANKCPVHKTLHKQFIIDTVMGASDAPPAG